MKKRVAILLIMLILPYASAGLFDFFRKEVRLAPSGQTNITVQVGNSAPVIFGVQSISSLNLLAGTTKDAIFNFTARDNNGVSDLDDSTASTILTRSGEPIRTGSCSLVETTALNKTYQCTVTMQYYDDNGNWNINVTIKDIAQGLIGENSTTSFLVELLRDMSINPASIGFPIVVPGGTNTLSSQNTEITNNGNFEVPSDGSLIITSYNLTGLNNPAEYIPAENFNIAGLSGVSTVCATGTSLDDEISVNIAGINLPRGTLGSNKENITYCLTSIPIISSQTYSTNGVGSQAWTISI